MTILAFIGGLLLGGALTYIYYAKIAAKAGAIITDVKKL